MSRLIYCAHATIDSDEPDWIGKVAANPYVQHEQWCLYRPSLGLAENAREMKGMVALLKRSPRISREIAGSLKVDPAVFASLESVQNRLMMADHGPFLDVSFKRLYVLLRADVVLVDLNVPDHGCRTVEAMYAYLADIPTVGIASRFIMSPGLTAMMEAVLFPRNSDQIVRQILAFDNMVTASIKHHRAAELQREQTERLAEKVAELKAEQGAEPDGRNESAG